MTHSAKWVVAAVIFSVVGCSETKPPEKPVAKQWPDLSIYAHAGHFPDGMQPLKLVSKAKVDGRELALYRTEPKDGNPGGRPYPYLIFYKGKQLSESPDIEGEPRNTGYELRDAKTNKPILPLDYQKIVVIPNVAVYVQDAACRLNPSEQYLGSDTYTMIRWQRLDVNTGKLLKEGAQRIEAYPRAGGECSWVVMSDKRQSFDRNVRKLSADVFSTPGHLLGHYEGFSPAVGGLITTRGKFSFLTTRQYDVAREYLLGEKLELLAALQHRVTSIGGYIARPAPNTVASDDLWVILQKNGEFGAPPGVRGFRPVSEAWSPDTSKKALADGATIPAGSWLVRFAMPGEPGFVEGSPAPKFKWGEASSDFTKISEPKWAAADIMFPPTADPNKTTYREQFWQRPVLVVHDGTKWTASTIGWGARDKDHSPALLKAEGDTSEQVVQKMFAQCAATKATVEAKDRAEYAQFKAKQDAFWAAHRKQQADSDWHHAILTNNANVLGSLAWERGGDAWYDYAIRVIPRSEFILEDAANRVKTPWKAVELRKMAAERRAELAREYEANRQRAAADLAAQQRATQNYSSGFSGAGGSSLSVPPLSQQQQDYRSGVQLNKSIYGTSWDPYK